uniref:Uncharacterized protein n=1 Tax=Panagrolaimus davidi TaxID=227884 RepID=A0A914QR83_9BILA
MVSNIDIEKAEQSRIKTDITAPPSAFPSHPINPGIKDARKKGLPWLIAALVVMVFALLLLLLVFILLNNTSFTHSSSSSSLSSSNSKKSLKDLTKDDWPSQSPNSLQATFSKTAVASDNGLCSEIGRSVLLKGGNAIDAGIATSFCIGGLNGHSSGIGGGFLATIYDSKIKKCVTIDARETAPLATNENTFYNNPKDAFIVWSFI